MEIPEWAKELMARPNEWAVVLTTTNQTKANSFQRRIQGHQWNWMKGHKFESARRREHGVYEIYARYVV